MRVQYGKVKKRNYKIVVVNYADEKYVSAQNINSKTALKIGKADMVYSFSPEDIDENFQKKYHNILTQKRGAGLWLWKPYFIDRVLQELNEGDILFYCDSGAFFTKKIEALLEACDKDKFDIFCCDIPLIERQFTKKKTFEIVENIARNEIMESNQIIGTYFAIKKNDATLEFVKEWLSCCCEEKYIFPSEGKDEFKGFIAHREDQSIFSLLCKKNGVEVLEDFSQRRYFPYSYKYKNCILRKHKYETKVPVIIYLHKKEKITLVQIIKQLISFCITSIKKSAE